MQANLAIKIDHHRHHVDQSGLVDRQIANMVQHPKDYGIGSGDLPLQPYCVYGLDETPFLYAPKVRTYADMGQRRVVIQGSGEKRSPPPRFLLPCDPIILHCLFFVQSRNLPLSQAPTGIWSCSSRVIWNLVAIFSAVVPM